MPLYKFKTEVRGDASNDNIGLNGPYAELLGSKSWKALPPAITTRFSKNHSNAATVYQGFVVSTDYNLPGQILAQCLRCIGSPLPLFRGNEESAATVVISQDPDGITQHWTRRYDRPGRFPHVIQSAKQFSGSTGLEENIGYGIGMTLSLSTEPDALIFSSEQYFLKLFGRRIPLPRLLMPGRMRVSHTDHGDGWFEFRLILTHAVFGKLLDQRAMFFDKEHPQC